MAIELCASLPKHVAQGETSGLTLGRGVSKILIGIWIYNNLLTTQP